MCIRPLNAILFKRKSVDSLKELENYYLKSFKIKIFNGRSVGTYDRVVREVFTGRRGFLRPFPYVIQSMRSAPSDLHTGPAHNLCISCPSGYWGFVSDVLVLIRLEKV